MLLKISVLLTHGKLEVPHFSQHPLLYSFVDQRAKNLFAEDELYPSLTQEENTSSLYLGLIGSSENHREDE